MFSCDFCKISENTSFTEHLLTTASLSRASSDLLQSDLLVHFFLRFLLVSVLLGSFHVKWTKVAKVGTWPIQILMKLFQMKSIYDIGISWKSQHKLIICSKVMTPRSCHSMLKIDKNWAGQAAWVYFWVSITFMYLTQSSEICCTFSVPRGL